MSRSTVQVESEKQNGRTAGHRFAVRILVASAFGLIERIDRAVLDALVVVVALSVLLRVLRAFGRLAGLLDRHFALLHVVAVRVEHLRRLRERSAHVACVLVALEVDFRLVFARRTLCSTAPQRNVQHMHKNLELFIRILNSCVFAELCNTYPVDKFVSYLTNFPFSIYEFFYAL